MSYNQWRMAFTGLGLAASCGLAMGMGAGGDEPMPRERAVARPAAAVEDRYLLLTDGRLIRGVIAHDETTYIVTQKLGELRFPKKLVERSFDTVREAYQYRLERLPENDPGERLMLARWCLNLHMTGEAMAQLEKVLELSPDHKPARAMLTKITQAEAIRLAGEKTKVNAAVQQTGGEEEVAEDRPGALDSAVLRGAERRMGISGAPVIFGLPAPLANLRAQQFREFVHPVLQAYCAKCHNADYNGPFQLLSASNSRSRTRDILRANLDATLRLVDPEDPAKSELLSSTLRPHGQGGRRRPIFSGWNDRAYQVLATWANSLRVAEGSEAVARSGNRAAADDDEEFAADRNRAGLAGLDPVIRGMKTGDPRQISAMARPAAQEAAGRAYRFVEGQGMVAEDPQQADPHEFPLPFMLGGPRPGDPSRAATKGEARSRPPASRPGATKGDPAAVRAGMDDADASDHARRDPEKPRNAPSKADGAAKKKSVKIDPAILEKLLQKNANRSAGQ